MEKKTSFIDPGSFRDPSGAVFRGMDGKLYRQINQTYETDYRLLMESGLYEQLTREGLLVEHEEVSLEHRLSDSAFKIIRPREIAFVSYPYEWCFSELKEAALLTLEIQKKALKLGLTLKDCSAYNIQFEGYRPIFIDTLSFEKYSEGKPWPAYRQFCQHFLVPLALMAFCDIRLNQLFRVYIDGVPLDLSSKLLPWQTRLRLGLFLHLHLHARAQRKYENHDVSVKNHRRGITRVAHQGLIDSLETTIRTLSWSPTKSAWADYYQNNTYTSEALEHKRTLVARYMDLFRPQIVWDLGANTGLFSRIPSYKGIPTIAYDVDSACTEMNFLTCRDRDERCLLPLCMDLTNPSPGLGWAHKERYSLIDRGPADVVLALALIHHLAIANNVPFSQIAEFLSKLCRVLVIEFVPKNDPQVQKLLRSRDDIFPWYTVEGFENAFGREFKILEQQRLKESDRVLFLMQSRGVQTERQL